MKPRNALYITETTYVVTVTSFYDLELTMTTQQLVEQYVPLANKLAFQRKKTLPRFINVEELQSAAYMGLVEAASRFDPSLGIAFSTFAYPRIFGAIHDYLREQGWLRRGGSFNILSLDSKEPDEDTCLKDTLAAPTKDDTEECFNVITRGLDTQAQQVLRHYFIDDLSMKEVGDKFGVSESRISQLIKQYKSRLRSLWTREEIYMELAA